MPTACIYTALHTYIIYIAEEEHMRFPLKWLCYVVQIEYKVCFFLSPLAEIQQQLLTDCKLQDGQMNPKEFLYQMRRRLKRVRVLRKRVYTNIFPSSIINTKAFVSQLLLFHLWGLSIELVSNISAPSSSNVMLLLLPRLLHENDLPR